MSLSYADALAEIQGRGRFGVRLGLGRTRAILRAMGDPQERFRGALVAGTNGKGSVLALAGGALREAGLRAGETPKPHLLTYRERLRIAGRLVDARTFARLVEEALPIVDRVARRLGEPTEFEVLTALAYRWFADERVDLAVIEVGLGGRLDATHAWDGGVAAIVNVDLDHTAYLGPTVEAIAREKAAIVLRGDRAVTGATGSALDVIRRRARLVGADLTVVEPARLLSVDRDGIVVDLPRLGETRVGLRGRHQAANVAVADALLDALEAAGIARVAAGARLRGYAGARWPGRLDLVTADGPGGPRDVLLDGAHNPAGAAVLAAALADLRPLLSGWDARRPAPVTLVTATMGDKDVTGIVATLASAPALAGARVVCTSLPEARALPADVLAAAWRGAVPGVAVSVVPDPRAALEAALASGEGPVIVAGSLYLVGALRPLLVDDPDLADPDDPATAPVVRGWTP
jgi:dihydrofolate synthase/folylpolyglutamate synthase